ncbi:DnaJ domain-containing protein [Hamiltosporidium tvaerminnensis]|uniref:DnaJ domain-containing protein n=1 Tax=Hamiltosporidium tvaerminnensis TaxID=1176355 RepID=A0A4Q9L1I6_9MICR|nr:hypothetical protein LUQ84_002004 [Hamiltosporidium tvaerminnensis]TBU01228.1 DnaJ domain-containing protein [Hamiltosporidium tvaerminnensis]
MDPYKVLRIEKGSDITVIKKAYKKLVLKYHPDRPNGDENKYLEIREAFEYLSKDTVESETINVENIINSYKNGPEEKEEIKYLYMKYKGDMCKIIDNMILGEDTDETRVRIIIDELISNKDIVKYKKYCKKITSNKRRMKKKEKEAKEAENWAKEQNIDLNESLESYFNRKNQERKAFLENLEEKYLKRK